MKKNLINRKVIKLIETDDSFNANQQQIIVSIYEKATTNEKEKIDNIFIALTGYSLNSILNFKSSLNSILNFKS